MEISELKPVRYRSRIGLVKAAGEEKDVCGFGFLQPLLSSSRHWYNFSLDVSLKPSSLFSYFALLQIARVASDLFFCILELGVPGCILRIELYRF